ncbi:MAG: septum site-determining protein MinC [Lachnospiraceae bacterium]|nr:septum site-determining protein MinC [Lachnospiraceae bacterium]
MKNPVIIKNFPNGLSVILDPDIPFDELYTALGKKFRESSKFFGKAKLVISFSGRVLEEEEERLLTDAIADNSELTVLCIVGTDDEKNQQYIKAGSRFVGDQEKMLSRFYKGPIRAGEVVESDTDLIILGDVNPGAEVISAGNIIILGTLYGTARAGSNGNEASFVVALDLRPVKICISDYSMNIFSKKGLFRSKAVPKIVFLREGELLAEEISTETIDKLSI